MTTHNLETWLVNFSNYPFLPPSRKWHLARHNY